MVKKNLMTFNPDAVTEIRKVAAESNDVIEQGLRDNEYLFVIKHDKDNPLTFTVLSDPYIESRDEEDDDNEDEDEDGGQYSLVGTKLTFADPNDFKRLFPDLAQLPPVQLGPNQKRDNVTGQPVGILPDEIEIKSIVPYDINDKIQNPYIVIELAELSLNITDTMTANQVDDKAGSIWIMWQHNKLDPKPYIINIAIAENNNSGNFTILQSYKNKPTNPTLQDGNFEIYELPNNTKINRILVQVNNALTNISPPITSMLQILKTVRVTRSKPVI